MLVRQSLDALSVVPKKIAEMIVKAMEEFMKKLSASKTSSEASRTIYVRSAKRLYRLLEEAKEFPKNSEWLKKKDLRAKYEKVPLNKRRHLSLAAHVWLKAFKTKNDGYWSERMYKDSNDYAKSRKENKKSQRESDKWIPDALSKLKKLATEFKRTINSELKKEPTVKRLWLYTQYIILRFYSEVQLRNDLGNISLNDDKKSNLLKKKKGGKFTIVMRDYKVSKQLGTIEINLSVALSRVLSVYLKYRSKLELPHEWLLSNSKGKKLSKSGLGKVLRKLTSNKLGKSIGSRMLRVFNATNNAEIIKKAKEIANNMLHSQKQSQDYVRK